MIAVLLREKQPCVKKETFHCSISTFHLWHISSQNLTLSHTTTFKFCRRAHLLNKLLMSKINLHISSNFFKLLCIGKRCFQPEVAKSSHIMCFINWAPMLVQIFPWTGVSDYQKLHLVAPATADKFLIEKHMNKLIWRNLWMMLAIYEWCLG